MLRDKKKYYPNGISGPRRLPRPHTEILSNGNYNYERYSRPLSSIFPESLQRCLKELNEKQQSSAPVMRKFNLKPVTRFYVDTDHKANQELRFSNTKKPTNIFPVLEKKKSPFALRKADSNRQAVPSSQWYISSPNKTGASNMGNVCKNGKREEKEVKTKRLDHWSHLAKSLPSLLTPFGAVGESIEEDNLKKEEKTEEEDTFSDHEIEIIKEKIGSKMNDPRISVVSNTGTVYEEPWDSQKVMDKWINMMPTVKETENAIA